MDNKDFDEALKLDRGNLKFNRLVRQMVDLMRQGQFSQRELELGLYLAIIKLKKTVEVPAYAGCVPDEVKALRELVSAYGEVGCPHCGGDCASANPPVLYCPMKAMENAKQVLERWEWSYE